MFKRTAHPEIIVAAASAIWGLLWIPLRAFDRQGMAPGWVIVCQFVAPLVLMFPLAVGLCYYVPIATRWNRVELFQSLMGSSVPQGF